MVREAVCRVYSEPYSVTWGGGREGRGGLGGGFWWTLLSEQGKGGREGGKGKEGREGGRFRFERPANFLFWSSGPSGLWVLLLVCRRVKKD